MRSVRPPLVVMVLAWLLVVAAVGVLTYTVVGNAGREVGRASAAATTAPLPTPTSSAPPASSPAAAPAPTRTATPGPTTTRTAAPVPAPTRSGRPAPSAATRTTAAPASVTRSFTTQGGTVVATCTGSTVRLDSITVRDGWRFETESEHGALEVKFKASETEVELTIRCVAGVPTRVED